MSPRFVTSIQYIAHACSRTRTCTHTNAADQTKWTKTNETTTHFVWLADHRHYRLMQYGMKNCVFFSSSAPVNWRLFPFRNKQNLWRTHWPMGQPKWELHECHAGCPLDVVEWPDCKTIWPPNESSFNCWPLPRSIFSPPPPPPQPLMADKQFLGTILAVCNSLLCQQNRKAPPVLCEKMFNFIGRDDKVLPVDHRVRLISLVPIDSHGIFWWIREKMPQIDHFRAIRPECAHFI